MAGKKKDPQPPFSHPEGTERLQVVLARFGIASRRGVVSMIEDGKVFVNGKQVLEKGFRVDPKKDKIRVEGQELPTERELEKRYFILNKPKGVMTTLQDPHAERTVADFFKDVPERLFPVGRLDRDTTGLLMMTNDGELAFRLTHPKFGVTKRYRARVEGLVTDEEKSTLERGVMLEEGPTAPCTIHIESRTPKETILTVVLHEGKKRQVRRIFENIGHYVTDLVRTDFGPLSLGDLKFGQKRELKPHEVRALEEATKLRKLARPAPSPRPEKKRERSHG